MGSEHNSMETPERHFRREELDKQAFNLLNATSEVFAPHTHKRADPELAAIYRNVYTEVYDIAVGTVSKRSKVTCRVGGMSLAQLAVRCENVLSAIETNQSRAQALKPGRLGTKLYELQKVLRMLQRKKVEYTALAEQIEAVRISEEEADQKHSVRAMRLHHLAHSLKTHPHKLLSYNLLDALQTY